jgi:hypothetical protein
VIGQDHAPPHHQLVTFSLPGLKRATVRVPEHVWVAGEHLAISESLIDLMSKLLPFQHPGLGEFDTDDLEGNP